jgi:C4-dicarboxylate-specific signal transduction histidine kinase
MEYVLDQPQFKIECRAVQITQVLLNLINNAHDAIKENRERWIKLEIKVIGDDVEFRVRNSGQKISKEVVAKIFDPFYTTKRAGEGTGLGLSISLKIAKEHKGILFVDEADAYTCFVLRIATKHSA